MRCSSCASSCSVAIGVDVAAVEEGADAGACVDEEDDDVADVDEGVDRVLNSGADVDEGDDRVLNSGVDADEGADKVLNIMGVVDAVVVDVGANDGVGVDEWVVVGADGVPNSGEVDVVGLIVGVDAGVDASFVYLCNNRCMFLCGLVGCPFNGNGDISSVITNLK